MKTKLFLSVFALFFVALFIGCKTKDCNCKSTCVVPNEVQQVGDSSVNQSKTAPYIIVVEYPSVFVNGYFDGYNGRWVAPIQALLLPQYRAGWNLGRKDFLSGRPNRYVK